MNNKRWLSNPAFYLLLISLFLLAFRLFLRSPLLELDEAEQVVMAQHLSPGYPAQPPLYAWIQYFVFQGLGYSLLSLALVKYSLLFACLYIFHRIALSQGESLPLGNNPGTLRQFAWCASLAWLFIPPIGFDLVKDNTHSILALLSACLTWYWFLKLDKQMRLSWYIGLGLIVGIGFLSKYNYLIFLGIFLLSVLSLKAWRQNLRVSGLLLSLLLALLIASPYLHWLVENHALGLSSTYKLTPVDKSRISGLTELIKSTLFFILPALIIFSLTLPLNFRLKPMDNKSQLLRRYHWISIIVLASIVLIGGLGRFETRWLIPIYFISPLLWLIHLPSDQKPIKHFSRILIIALLIQSAYCIALLYRSHDRHKIRNQFPFDSLVHSIPKENIKIDYLVSDSHWILGNLLIKKLPGQPEGWLIHGKQSTALPPGKLLCLWEQDSEAEWLAMRQEGAFEIHSLLDKRVLGWYIIPPEYNAH